MVSFLMMLALAPVEWGFTWMYASPLRRMDGYFWGKLIVRVVLAVAILGGLGAQLNFVANREPSLHARQFYLLALLIIEAVPGLAILFYRYYQNPSSYWSGWNYQAKRPPKER